MTTIAYHHESGIVAVDSRGTSNGIITDDDHNKIAKFNNGMIIIGSGDSHSVREMSKHYAGESEAMNGSIDHDTLLMVIHKGKAAKVGYDKGDGFWTEILSCNMAIGSGSLFALAGMDFNLGAEDAVKYAMTRDSYTGGKVRTVSLLDTEVK